MSLEKTLTRRIIESFLPPWTERVGYPPSRPELAALFPDRTSPIPMDFAPSSSLDGIYLDGDDAARDSRQLTGQLETLAPGGIAVMILSREHWTAKGLRQACEGTGFRILFSSSIKSGQKILPTSEGLPVPASWFQRIFRAGRLATFPALSFPRGKGLFVVLQKKFSQSLSSRTGISVVMLMPEDRNDAARMLISWDSFLKEKKFDDAQLVYVEDSHLDPPPLNLQADAIRKVDHYRPTGPYGALRSGLAFSRGRKVIVDFSRGTVDPSLCMPLLDRFIQEEKNMGKKHFAVQAVDYRMRNPYGWLKGFFLRFIAGTVYPDCPLRIYPAWTASLLADLHPEEIKRNPLLFSMTVKRNGGRFLNEKLNVSHIKNALKLSVPGMIFSYLRMRTGKILGYLFLSALALSAFPVLDRTLSGLQAAMSSSDLSLGWILSGSAILMGWNNRFFPDNNSSFGAFQSHLRNRIPFWENTINRSIARLAQSTSYRTFHALLQIIVISSVFYLASALILFRRPGRQILIVSAYFLHLLLILFLLGSPVLGGWIEQLQDGIWELSRIVLLTAEGRWMEHGLTTLSLSFLGALELSCGFLIIFLFRRKYL
ncbi:MAG TPA: hypothetical protein DEA96_00565 [Leptospiraceae bacterium]|nr:hypothetical protein [Spirochaetaceae bacterium]HBS03425.1 hypothetical protein [Leptospiraceae bacterium]|tara:strand:+ start:1619 stop:3412 length:1794 start_codon:yes stop_codon:yes gene_type:complete